MTESRVVPFERGTSFLHARAMKQKRSGNLLEALELLRRATEEAPQGQGYWKDMADVYADMNCYMDSRFMVLMQLFHQPEDIECFYWLAKCDVELGDMDEARRALNCFLKKAPEHELIKEARDELENIELSDTLWHQVDRQSRRSVRRFRQVRDFQLAQEFEDADRILAREQAGRPDDPQLHVSRAMNLYMMGDKTAAQAQLEQAEDIERQLPGTVILAAQVYYRLGDLERATRLIDGLDVPDLSLMDLKMVICLLTDMNQNDRAFRVGREILRQAPYDRMMLHLMAVNAVRSGMKDEVAAGFWRRIIRLNPEDCVARWYLNALEAGKLSPNDVNDGYQLPSDEVMRRGQIVIQLMQQSPEQIKRAWDDADVRFTLRWALMSEVPELVSPVLRLLVAIDNEDTIQMLAEFIASTQLGFGYDFCTSAMINSKDYWAKAGVKQYLNVRYFTTDFNSLISNIGVARRQMIRMADDVMRMEYGISEKLKLAVLWSWLGLFDGDFALRDLRCSAAALALHVLRNKHVDVSEVRLARQFGCSVRKLRHYDGWIQKTMNAEEDDETLGLF